MADDEETKVQEVTTVTTSPDQVVKTTKHIKKEPAVKTEPPQQVFETKKSIFRTYQIVWYILGFVETLLIFRLLLKVVGADPLSGFALLIYGLSDVFALPFNGVLGVTATPEGSIFEWSTLIAMAVYWVIAYGIVQLFQIIKPVGPREVEDTVDSV